MRPLVVSIVLAALGCRSDPGRPSQPTPIVERTPAGSGSATPRDPWIVDTTPDPDAPPSFAERHRIADEACPVVKAPYFFRIEKAGKVSHILGTRHLGVSLAKFPPVVHDTAASARLAVFEIAPDDDSDLPAEKVVLRDALGPDLWKHYQELVGETVAQSFESASPTIAYIAMSAMYEDISAALDGELQRVAQEANIPTRGLETSEFQDRLIRQLLDLRMLRASIAHTKDRKELETESRKELGKYCAGGDYKPGLDDKTRADLLASGYTEAELANIDEQMVFARNADWIPKLEKILAGGNVFIAVGADHLRGPKGVVALLAKRGYKLTRVTQ